MVTRKGREELVLDHVHLCYKLTVTWWTSSLRLLGPFQMNHLKNRQYTLLRANWESKSVKFLRAVHEKHKSRSANTEKCWMLSA